MGRLARHQMSKVGSAAQGPTVHGYLGYDSLIINVQKIPLLGGVAQYES